MLTKDLMAVFTEIKNLHGVTLSFTYLQEFCKKHNLEATDLLSMVKSKVFRANQEGLFYDPDYAALANKKGLKTSA